MEKPYIQKLTLSRPGLDIFLVDGPWVRTNHNVDYIMGGHDLVYNFIPKGQIWIDDSIEAGERPLTLLHELYERHRMATKKETYDVAHDFAKAFEKKYRKDPTGLHEKIKELLDMNRAEGEKVSIDLRGLQQGITRWAGDVMASPILSNPGTVTALAQGSVPGVASWLASPLIDRGMGRATQAINKWKAGRRAMPQVVRPVPVSRPMGAPATLQPPARTLSKTAAYRLGFSLALKHAGFQEEKEEPTRPTHKNPGPVPTDPTSVIESTPKQDTCAVSPKTY